MANWLSLEIAALPNGDAIAEPASERIQPAMSTGGPLLSRMARLFGARPGSYYVAALVPGVAGVAVMTTVFAFPLQGRQPGSVDPLNLWRSFSAGGRFFVILGMIFGFWTPILLAARATCRIAASLLENQPLSLAATLVDMAGFVPSALVYSLVFSLSAAVGGSMFFLPAFFVLSAYTLVVPAGVLESTGIFATLRRGVSLGFRVFGRSLLRVFGSTVLMILLAFLRIAGLDRLVSGNPTQVLAFRYALMYLPGLLVVILTNICFTLLCVEARGMEAAPKPATTQG